MAPGRHPPRGRRPAGPQPATAALRTTRRETRSPGHCPPIAAGEKGNLRRRVDGARARQRALVDPLEGHDKDGVLAGLRVLERRGRPRQLVADDLDLPLLGRSRPRLVPGTAVGERERVAVDLVGLRRRTSPPCGAAGSGQESARARRTPRARAAINQAGSSPRGSTARSAGARSRAGRRTASSGRAAPRRRPRRGGASPRRRPARAGSRRAAG